jgi:ABC-type dipeptide/oligopeptide/nickel transport system permease component
MVGMEIGTAIGVCIYIESASASTGSAGSPSRRSAAAVSHSSCRPLSVIVVLITLVVVVGNLVVDALYAVLDPRVGIQQSQQRTKSLVIKPL